MGGLRLSSRAAGLAWLLGTLAACGGGPRHRFTSAADAVSQLRAGQACSTGVKADAKADFYGKIGNVTRVRGNVIYQVVAPDKIRFDIYSPFGAIISTLTSDGSRFALFDLQNRALLRGPASACNVARFTRIPVPPHALVAMLRGQPRLLVHEASAPTIRWESSFFGGGEYLIEVPSRHQAVQRLKIAVHPDDWDKPTVAQRLRLQHVEVEQADVMLYTVDYGEYAPAPTAKGFVDPDGLEPDVAPSGPACRAELPRTIAIEVPSTEQDLRITARGERKIVHNPPLLPGAFRQTTPDGVVVRHAVCSAPATAAPAR